MNTSAYDIILLGAGCAGLSLLLRLADNPDFDKKKVLLIDRDTKKTNDRTWCFWETGQGYFEPILTKSWGDLEFKSNDFSGRLDVGPYRYKMIRGLDFYTYCFTRIKTMLNVEVIHDEVVAITPTDIQLSSTNISRANALVFSSLFSTPPQQKGKHYLLQHFKGWVIETEKDCFNEQVATLMDFTVSQANGTGFVYVLPLTPRKALIEYTLFSPELLSPRLYDEVLRQYIAQRLQGTSYNIREEEFGVIPMTNARFPRIKEGVYQIGTAGGQTKASTGYTFQFIQQQATQIAANLRMGKEPLHGIADRNGRFMWYDRILLHVLAENKLPGDKVFARLFARNKASLIFRFLDNATHWGEELRIMASVQQAVFIRAAWAECWR